jgi:hypothetical protein
MVFREVMPARMQARRQENSSPHNSNRSAQNLWTGASGGTGSPGNFASSRSMTSLLSCSHCPSGVRTIGTATTPVLRRRLT